MFFCQELQKAGKPAIIPLCRLSCLCVAQNKTCCACLIFRSRGSLRSLTEKSLRPFAKKIGVLPQQRTNIIRFNLRTSSVLICTTCRRLNQIWLHIKLITQEQPVLICAFGAGDYMKFYFIKKLNQLITFALFWLHFKSSKNSQIYLFSMILKQNSLITFWLKLNQLITF